MHSVSFCRFVGVMLAVTFWASTQQPANAYEIELRSAAGKLVTQLENVGQKSGTVIDFTDLQGQGTELGRFLAQELSDKLVEKAKIISFIDRTNLQHLLRENKLTMDGLINPETSRKLGNMIGIDTVIYGTVTPIGSSVRLSIRAVAVETGKIVASQSTTIPVVGELGQLYTRGTANSATQSTSSPAEGGTGSSIRARLRADSIKISATELAVHAEQHAEQAKLGFSIENRSGVGLGMAVRENGFSAGPCTPDYAARVNGLGIVSENQLGALLKETNPSRLLRWVPAGSKVSGTLTFNTTCNGVTLSGLRTVPLNLTLIVGSETEGLVLPLSVDGIPIRVYGQR